MATDQNMTTITKRNILLLTLVTTVIMWGFVSYKTAALLTGRLGPVNYRWSNLLREGQYVTWASRAVTLNFDHNNHLVLPPGGRAQFIIDPPRHFRRMSVAIDHTGDLKLQAEYRRGITGNIINERVINVRLVDLAKLNQGYRFTIVNESTSPIAVGAISVKFIR